MLLCYVGRVREVVEAHAEAIAVFRKVGGRRAEARAKNLLAFAMLVMERFEDTGAAAKLDILETVGSSFPLCHNLVPCSAGGLWSDDSAFDDEILSPTTPFPMAL